MSYFKNNLISKMSLMIEKISDSRQIKKISEYFPERKLSLPENFTVTFHSGALRTKDNTVESVIIALEHGAKVVEVDVTFRPDLTPCVIHKSKPTENEGVLLSDILSVVAGSDDCKINLDIKSVTNLPAVDRLVKEYGLFERVFYTGVFEDWVESVRNNSEIPYYLNSGTDKTKRDDREYAAELAKKIKSLGAAGLNTHFGNVSQCIVDVMHENGLSVSAWTANTVGEQCRLLSMGVDNITTRKPLRLMRCIEFLS